MKRLKKFLDNYDIRIRNNERIKFTELLFLVLLHAKITGGVAWSWFWITLPLTFTYFVFYFMVLREGYIVFKMAKEKKKKEQEDLDKFINAK